MKSLGRWGWTSSCLLWTLVACGGLADGGAAGEVGSESEEPTPPPAVPDLEPGELLSIEPEDGTVCSRGTPFRFFVIGGSVNKVVVDFAGGGACWDQRTCSIADAIFTAEAPSEDLVRLGVDSGLLSGIYASNTEENLFKDWFRIYVPYCTGDVHWGDAIHEYAPGLTIRHRGYVNATAALTWAFERFEAPEQIFVTGCSAGAYGAIMHSARVAREYPGVRMAAMGDSGAGVITDSFFADSFPKWGAGAHMPNWVPAFDRDPLTMDITDIYTGIADTYPQHRFAQFNSAFDQTQIQYLAAMGGDRDGWSGRARAFIDDIRGRSDNFRSYTAAGDAHCITPFASMYTENTAGVRFLDWLDELVNGETMPDDVSCQGEDCR